MTAMEVSTIGYEYQETYQLFNQSTYVEIIDNNGQLVNDGESRFFQHHQFHI